ncbi:MAG: NUDIX domain-containing protein [Dehalococcoidia bacterium]|nr:NUDIX domain-containing protein [Dehalococcoidia bacterium]
MEVRVRAAALIVQGDAVLLVQHHQPGGSKVWWVPPGGGRQESKTLRECVLREVFEETGLSVELGDIVYVREFIAPEIQQHNFEFFFLAKSFTGTPTLKNVLAADNIRDVQFIARQGMAKITVYPEVLKDGFWDDLKRGFPEKVYLGVQISGGELMEPG